MRYGGDGSYHDGQTDEANITTGYRPGWRVRSGKILRDRRTYVGWDIVGDELWGWRGMEGGGIRRLIRRVNEGSGLITTKEWDHVALRICWSSSGHG